MGHWGHHLHHHESPLDGAPAWALEQFALSLVILENTEKIMSTLDQVVQDLTDESTQLDAIAAAVSTLVASHATIPSSVQAQIDAAFAQAEVNKSKIAGISASLTPVTAPSS